MYPKHLKEILFALFSSLSTPRRSHIDKKPSAVFTVSVSAGQICAVINRKKTPAGREKSLMTKQLFSRPCYAVMTSAFLNTDLIVLSATHSERVGEN